MLNVSDDFYHRVQIRRVGGYVRADIVDSMSIVFAVFIFFHCYLYYVK